MIYPLALRLAQSLPAPAAQSSVIAARQAFNSTIPCIFDGLEFFAWSPALNFTCESILQSATAAVTNAADARSVTSILWSCLATVFACTWVSVHPNIPHPDATEWQIRRHRFFMMLCGLIAPELIVLWALRQWVGARYLVRKMKAQKVKGFTLVHAHFMQMGGFMMYSKGARVSVIEDDVQLASCITDWKFPLPTAEEIRDRSKGDGLSKALVVGQTGWFVAQCISRWIASLAVTELELVTLAFAALNGVIYFLWWNKPVDVRYAVHVTRNEGASDSPDDDEHIYSSQNGFTTTTISAESFRDSGWKVRIGDDLQTMRRLVANSRIGRLLPILKPYLDREDDKIDKGRLRISLLHSNCDPQDTFAATAVASAVGILFGAIHCVAWNFHFLSPLEKTLWRTWCIIITAMPVVLLAKSAISYLFIRRLVNENDIMHPSRGRISSGLLWIITQISRPSIWATVALAPMYIVARVGLIVQALTALRQLQPRESAQLHWVNLLPHL